MNKGKVEQILELVDSHEFELNMAVLYEPSGCGTVGCLMGAALVLTPGARSATRDVLAEYLQISVDQADDLGYGGAIWAKYAKELELERFSEDDVQDGVPLDDITADNVRTMLTKLASGEWNWEGTE